MGLIPSPPGSVSGGSIRFRGRELVGMDEEERRRIRGKDIAMIFQEPMTALNPVFTVGDQIAETLMLHEGLERRAAWEKAAEPVSYTHLDVDKRQARPAPAWLPDVSG